MIQKVKRELDNYITKSDDNDETYCDFCGEKYHMEESTADNVGFYCSLECENLGQAENAV